MINYKWKWLINKLDITFYYNDELQMKIAD